MASPDFIPEPIPAEPSFELIQSEPDDHESGSPAAIEISDSDTDRYEEIRESQRVYINTLGSVAVRSIDQLDEVMHGPNGDSNALAGDVVAVVQAKVKKSDIMERLKKLDLSPEEKSHLLEVADLIEWTSVLHHLTVDSDTKNKLLDVVEESQRLDSAEKQAFFELIEQEIRTAEPAPESEEL